MQSSILISVFVSVCLVVVSGNNMTDEEDRKFIKPMLAIKPLIAASLLAGLKLPRPSVDFTVIKHESASTDSPSSSSTVTPRPTQSPVTSPPVQTPVTLCNSLNGFPCYSVPSGCVCVVSTQKPWVDAFNYCRANRLSLISFDSAKKQKEMETYLPLLIGDAIFTSIGFWTSGTFCLTHYTWASIPEYFTYANWKIGQPDLTNVPRASCIRAVPQEKYQWDDIDCGQFLPFICE